MTPCELTAAITAAANMLASKLSDNELSLLGAVFTQLGDTLETISAGRASCGYLCCNNKNENSGDIGSI